MTFLVWLGALVVLYVAVAAYAQVSNPATDLPSHFVLQAAAGAMVLMIIAIICGVHSKVYAVLLLAYILCIARLWPFLIKARAVESGGTTLKILQTNIQFGNQDMKPLRALIADEKPDIIAVAEANTPAAALFRELDRDYPHQRVIVRDDCGKGIAVLSKLVLEGLEQKALAIPDSQTLFFKVASGEKPVDVVVIHTANPTYAFKERDAELSALSAWCEKTLPHRLIVTGDLNATPYCPAFRSMMKRTKLKNARDGFGILGSWPTQTRLRLLRIPIDHVLVSETLRVVDFRLAPDIGSDHMTTISVIKL
jgi:endonuclease/exonuclease/phosphatase (EEP) superfamily protein YafD